MSTGSDGDDLDDDDGGLPAYLRDIDRPLRPSRMADAVEAVPEDAVPASAGGAAAADDGDGFAALERHLQLLGQLGLGAGSTSGAAAGAGRRRSVDGQVLNLRIITLLIHRPVSYSLSASPFHHVSGPNTQSSNSCCEQPYNERIIECMCVVWLLARRTMWKRAKLSALAQGGVDNGDAAQLRRERSSRSFDGRQPVPRLALPSIPDEVRHIPATLMLFDLLFKSLVVPLPHLSKGQPSQETSLLCLE